MGQEIHLGSKSASIRKGTALIRKGTCWTNSDNRNGYKLNGEC